MIIQTYFDIIRVKIKLITELRKGFIFNLLVDVFLSMLLLRIFLLWIQLLSVERKNYFFVILSFLPSHSLFTLHNINVKDIPR